MLYTTVLFLFFNYLFWTINAKPGRSSLHKKDIPALTLPWGTYQGELYGEDQEVSE